MGDEDERHDPSIPDSLTPAAVLVPLVRGEIPRLLFTKRAPDLDAHPGQISFPGGRMEEGDPSLDATALRETNEEIGVDTDAVEVFGRLEPITTVTGFYVEPLLGEIPSGPFTPDRSEVAEVIVLPVVSFLDDEVYRHERHRHPAHGSVDVHYFDVDGHTVWGATASILVQYLSQAYDWQPPTD